MSKLIDDSFKKDFETWNYFFSDEFVYAGESTSREKIIKGGYLERYLNSDLQLSCTIRYIDIYYLIVAQVFRQAINTRPIAKSKDEMRVTWSDFSMFMNSTNFVQPPKAFQLTPITTVIGLKAFNDRTSIDGYISQFTSNSIFRIIEIIKTIEDGKLCSRTGVLCSEQSQFPCQIIEGRTEVVSNFPNGNSPFYGGIPVYFEPEFIRRLGMILGNDFIRFGVRCQEQLGFPVEVLELFLCPDDFENGTIEWRHVLYSNNGRQENGQTENSPRLRNTHTKEKGRVRRTRKGGETDQASSSPPPEEVKSQTETSHHHGDYIAKHTHLGSLEDV